MKQWFSLLLLSLVLCACTTENVPSTATAMPTNLPPTETNIPTITSTETPIPTVTAPSVPTITAPPQREDLIILPGNLEIEEYPVTREEVWAIQDLVLARHPNHVMLKRYVNPSTAEDFLITVDGEEILVQQTTAWKDKTSGLHAFIFLSKNNDVFRTIDCGPRWPVGPILTAWTFENVLILQTTHDEMLDVWWDGEFLNQREGYQSSLGFQILNGKPFYFFRRDDKMWLSYDGNEALLPYDKIETSYCCMRYPIPSPNHFEDMITYFAIENGQEIFGVIGFLSEKP